MLSLKGRLLYDKFDSAAFLEENMRAGPGEAEWAEILARHRIGASTDDDLREIVDLQLRHRTPEVREQFERDRTVYCFPQHKFESELEPGEESFNDSKLHELNERGVPCGVCVAKDHRIRGCCSRRSGVRGLRKKLWIARGARVACTANLAQSFGVANGTLGTVWDVVYHEGVRPKEHQALPRLVLVKMDKWAGPQLCTEVKNLVPFVPVQLPLECHKGCTRTAFALTLAWGWTIHRAQGHSVGKDKPNERVVGHQGESEGNQLGRDYTLLSRASSKAAIALDGTPFTLNDLKQRTTKPTALSRYAALQAEDARLRDMSDSTVGATGCDDFDHLVLWASKGGARNAYAKWRRHKTNGTWKPPGVDNTAQAPAEPSETGEVPVSEPVPMVVDGDDP